MTRLNLCPLCGSEPDVVLPDIKGFVIRCQCGLSTDVKSTTGSSAINAWNDITANFNKTKTLRDEFAMAALMGMLAANLETPNSYKEFADGAYKQADAMIEERIK